MNMLSLSFPQVLSCLVTAACIGDYIAGIDSSVWRWPIALLATAVRAATTAVAVSWVIIGLIGRN